MTGIAGFEMNIHIAGQSLAKAKGLSGRKDRKMRIGAKTRERRGSEEEV